MGLLDKLKTAVGKGEQAVDKIVDATQEATKSVVSEAQDAANEVVKKGRQGAGAVADELKKARGIASGDIDGFVRPSAPYVERLLADTEKDLASQFFENTMPYGAIYISNCMVLGCRAYTILHT